MPIFRYHCNACGRELELLVARFDSPAECPLCGSSDLEKLPSVFSAVSPRGPAGCAARGDCPAAGSHQCGEGCSCGCGHRH